MTDADLKLLRDSLREELDRREVQLAAKSVRASSAMDIGKLMGSISERVKEFMPDPEEKSSTQIQIDLEVEKSQSAKYRTLDEMLKRTAMFEHWLSQAEGT